MKRFKAIYDVSIALENCIQSNNLDWEGIWSERIKKIMETAPSGSGFDSGTQLDSVQKNKIVFTTAFHHMNDAGYYDGWTEHKVIVTPDFSCIDIKVTGRNRNDIKDYIEEVFGNWLTSEVDSI
jgi:hypothetical protein